MEERWLLAARPEIEPAAGYLFRSACFYIARIVHNSLQTTTNKSAAQKQLRTGL
jgi:hypothetical protein